MKDLSKVKVTLSKEMALITLMYISIYIFRSIFIGKIEYLGLNILVLFISLLSVSLVHYFFNNKSFREVNFAYFIINILISVPITIIISLLIIML